MATTAIFAEILIIGFQAIVWLALASVTILGTQCVDVSVLKGWESLITLFVLAIAYALGIVVDRTADSVFHPFDRKLRKKYIPDSLPPVSEMRLQIMSESEGMAKFLDYVRSRVRIARSTALNLVLIICTFVLLSVTRRTISGSLSKVNFLAATVVVGAVVLTLTVFAWARITKTYYRRLVQAYQIVEDKSGGNFR